MSKITFSFFIFLLKLFLSFSSILNPLSLGWGWFSKNSFRFSFLPKSARIKPYPFFSNFSFTFFTASLLLDTTATVLFCIIAKFAIIFKIVCVFPVPGGPSIIEILLLYTFETASFWLRLNLNGYIKSIFSFWGFFNFFLFKKYSNTLSFGTECNLLYSFSKNVPFWLFSVFSSFTFAYFAICL